MLSNIRAKAPIHKSIKVYLSKLMVIQLALSLSFLPAQGSIGSGFYENIGLTGEITSMGHGAIFFDNICAENPLEFRLCQEHEMGMNISRYSSLMGNVESLKYDFMATPTLIHLYGVEKHEDIPLIATSQIEKYLENQYFEKYLKPVIQYREDQYEEIFNNGKWRSLVGALFHREVYISYLKTNEETDMELIAQFNQRENKAQFNAFFDNCADFMRSILNDYEKGVGGKRNIADFFIVSPKAVAHSVSKYGKKNLDTDYYMEKHAQVAGTFGRSGPIRNAMENSFRQNKYFWVSLLQPKMLATFFGLSLIFSRFSMYKEYKNHFSHEMTLLNAEIKNETSQERKEYLEALKKSKINQKLGTKEDWEHFHKKLQKIYVQLYIDKKISHPDFVKLSVNDKYRDFLKTYFEGDHIEIRNIEGEGLFLEIENKLVGFTAKSIQSDLSDPYLSVMLMLGVLKYNIAADRKDRDTVDHVRSLFPLLEQSVMRL